VFANTDDQQTQDVVTKYGLDLETWKEFAATRQTPNWEVSCAWHLTSNEYCLSNFIGLISIKLMEIIYATLQVIRKRAQAIQKHNDCPHLLSLGGYDLLEKKLLDEKRKRLQEDALLTKNTANIEDPSSPIKRHVKWKVARTKRYDNMTSDSAQEISDKIMS